MNGEPPHQEPGKPAKRWISDRASIILIGAVAIGGIILMCVIVAVLLYVRQNHS